MFFVFYTYSLQKQKDKFKKLETMIKRGFNREDGLFVKAVDTAL